MKIPLLEDPFVNCLVAPLALGHGLHALLVNHFSHLILLQVVNIGVALIELIQHLHQQLLWLLQVEF